MGWSSGSELFSIVIDSVKKRLPDNERRELYVELIPAFEDMDWDTQDECMGKDPMYEAALKELHPNWHD